MDSDVVRELDEIKAECTRIGFAWRELGGLAIAGEGGLTRFRNLLREIPTGVGLEVFLERMRSYGVDLQTAEEELRELEKEEKRATSCSFCGRSKTSERRLVHGPNGVAICSECVRLAALTLE